MDRPDIVSKSLMWNIWTYHISFRKLLYVSENYFFLVVSKQICVSRNLLPQKVLLSTTKILFALYSVSSENTRMKLVYNIILIRVLCSNMGGMVFLPSKSEPVKHCFICQFVFTIFTTYYKYLNTLWQCLANNFFYE